MRGGYIGSGAIRLGLALAIMGFPLPAAAQSNPLGASDRDARIDALEADLKRIEAELKALRQGNPPPSASSATALSATTPTGPP